MDVTGGERKNKNESNPVPLGPRFRTDRRKGGSWNLYIARTQCVSAAGIYAINMDSY